MHYNCSECGRPIGLMANMYGVPERYKCPHTGRYAIAQIASRRKAVQPSPSARRELLSQLGIRKDAQ